jgi:hypothetical protein
LGGGVLLLPALSYGLSLPVHDGLLGGASLTC